MVLAWLKKLLKPAATRKSKPQAAPPRFCRRMAIESLEDRLLLAANDLLVTALTPTATGFTATFSEPISPTHLALYGTGTQTQPSVTLVGAQTGPVRGTLVVDPSGTAVTFVEQATVLQYYNGTPPLLLPDTYTVTLLGGGATGFQDLSGKGLDGHNNGGVASYTTTFTVGSQAATAPTLGLLDFAAGPNSGSPVMLPSWGGNGLPVLLDNVTGVTDVTFTLNYNPALFAIEPKNTATGTVDATDPAGTSFTLVANDATAGLATFQFHDATPQDGTSLNPVILGDIFAAVPDSAGATYAAVGLLQPGNIVINGSARAATGAVGRPSVQVDAYPGDTDGNGGYDPTDATLALHVAAGLDTGFAAYPLIDPAVVGDVGLNGYVAASDASQIAAFAAGNFANAPGIPPLPNPVPALTLPSGLSATHFVVTAPASPTTGFPFTFTVTAQDQDGDLVPTFTGTVHFTSTDPGAILPANITLNNGTGTFTATLNTPGPQTLTAACTSPGLTGTSQTLAAQASYGPRVTAFTPTATGFTIRASCN